MRSLSYSARKKLIIDLFIGVFCIVTISYIIVALMNSKTFQLFGAIVPRVATESKVVALTFDDSPDPGATEELLSILERTDTKATFFLIGKQMNKHPEQTEKIITAGHELGNHTYTHYSLTFQSPDLIKREIELADKTIRAFGYNKPTHFRPPYGNKLLLLPLYLHMTDRNTIMWNIAPDDHPTIASNAEYMADHVEEEISPGSIIVMHPMYKHRKESLKAVEPIINRLKAKGYTFVTVTELLTYQKQ